MEFGHNAARAVEHLGKLNFSLLLIPDIFVTAQTALYHCTIASYHCTFVSHCTLLYALALSHVIYSLCNLIKFD